MERASFLDLPLAALLRVFEFAGLENFSHLRLVCKLWLSKTDVVADTLAVRAIKDLSRRTLALCEDLDKGIKGEKVEARLEFLEVTLQLLSKWKLPRLPHVYVWRRLVAELARTLRETHQVLLLVNKGEFRVNENFDVFELTLRRYVQGIEALKSLPDKPCDMIQDTEGRIVWINSFGARVALVTWKEFRVAILKNLCSRSVRRAIKFLINFPNDNVLTVYKFDLLLKWFGPFDALFRNVESHVLGMGFVGLVNRIHAKQLLEEHFFRNKNNRGWYLLRLSRTEPDRVVVSYVTPEGEFVHSLCRTNISRKLVREVPPNKFSVLPVYLSKEVHENSKSLRSYAAHSGYVTIHEDDDADEDYEDSPRDVDNDDDARAALAASSYSAFE